MTTPHQPLAVRRARRPTASQPASIHTNALGITWSILLNGVIQAGALDLSRGTRRTGTVTAVHALKTVLQVAHATRTTGMLGLSSQRLLALLLYI